MISAVCVNHKNFEFLPLMIDSLKKEGAGEIIIVDNSLDVEEKKKLETLKGVSLFFLENNNGLGQALNFGAGKARGDYILFCNPDLIFKEGSLQSLKGEMENCEATGPLIFWDREEEISLPYPFPHNFFNQFIRISFPEFYKKKYFSYQFEIWEGKNPKQLPLLSGSCFLIKKDSFEKTGGFDEDFFLYFEENDFFCRFKKMGFKAKFVPSSKIVHLYKINKGEDHKIFFEESRKKYEIKHFSKFSLKILDFLKRKKAVEEKINEWREGEKVENFKALISPYPDFIPSAFIKNLKNWAFFEEKMKKISFLEGFIGILDGKKISKSFYFKVK